MCLCLRLFFISTNSHVNKELQVLILILILIIKTCRKIIASCMHCGGKLGSNACNVGPPPPGGGGGTSILTVTGTCRWTGYDFAVITIDTGYLNRPNWLLADYSVYHRVASQPTMFMTGPRSRHQRRCVRDACYATDLVMNVWWYTAE